MHYVNAGQYNIPVLDAKYIIFENYHLKNPIISAVFSQEQIRLEHLLKILQRKVSRLTEYICAKVSWRNFSYYRSQNFIECYRERNVFENKKIAAKLLVIKIF